MFKKTYLLLNVFAIGQLIAASSHYTGILGPDHGLPPLEDLGVRPSVPASEVNPVVQNVSAPSILYPKDDIPNAAPNDLGQVRPIDPASVKKDNTVSVDPSVTRPNVNTNDELGVIRPVENSNALGGVGQPNNDNNAKPVVSPLVIPSLTPVIHSDPSALDSDDSLVKTPVITPHGSDSDSEESVSSLVDGLIDDDYSEQQSLKPKPVVDPKNNDESTTNIKPSNRGFFASIICCICSSAKNCLTWPFRFLFSCCFGKNDKKDN